MPRCFSPPGERVITARYATSKEAPRIRGLLVEAFAEDVLPFTIYRSPQSVAHLATLAEEGRIRVVGDSDGVAISTENHLDYLAVAKRARGQGLGRALMDDFHILRDPKGFYVGTRASCGYRVGPSGATLDVLADNHALPWYVSLGYRTESLSFSARLALENTGRSPEDWDVARREERARGFSAVDYEGMRIGLLGETALRLLDPGGRSVEAALDALKDLGREEIVLTGLPEAPKGRRTIQCVTSLRMRRTG